VLATDSGKNVHLVWTEEYISLNTEVYYRNKK